ncbi:PKD domain-containing protein [Chitinophaga tropicalis]|uniref:PKD domain-containing protein n=1 Tax=Chitinophaga tropicalis TaxID=2683588 RepID=A0A7K1UBA1_9BACT|nr:PKD domain-containing protein [Chitinophaga tropicalis]MVT11633.1 PKD domain-containing protein [Chitinophaga tropicalis]
MKRFLLLFVFIFSCLCSSAQSALYPAFRIKQECATVFFYDSSYAVGAPIVKRKWYFGDGTSDTALNPVHVYGSRAMYNVTLVVENSEGKRDSSILYDLYVNTPFNAEITLSKGLYDSLGIDYFFDRYTCTWYLNDEPFPSGNYMWECFPSENGVYKVIVKSHDGCIDTSAPFIYNRKDSIFADIYHYISNTCKPSEITFQGEYSGSEWLSKVDSVRWDFGDGQSSTRERFDYFTHNYATPGTYVVKLTPFISSGYTRAFTKTIVVSKWSVKIVPDSVAVAGARTLSAISNPEISSVIWSTGEKTNKISIQQSGIYSVWGKDACGTIRAADTLYVDITLATKDTVQLETGAITGNDSLAIKAAFNQDFNADNVFNIQLSFDNSGGRGLQPGEVISLGTANGTSGNTSLKVAIPDTLACAVNYVLRIVASSPADTTEWSQPFSIINQPQQPVIIQRGDSLFTTSPYNLQWYKNGQPVEGATNSYYRARVNASYTVEAQNGTGCSSMSDARSVVITAVGDVTLGENTVKTYPNPSSGTVYLQFGKPVLKTVTINVYDLKGKLHYTRTTRQQLQPLDLSLLPEGYYLVEVNGYGTRKVLSIILQ